MDPEVRDLSGFGLEVVGGFEWGLVLGSGEILGERWEDGIWGKRALDVELSGGKGRLGRWVEERMGVRWGGEWIRGKS